MNLRDGGSVRGVLRMLGYAGRRWLRERLSGHDGMVWYVDIDCATCE